MTKLMTAWTQPVSKDKEEAKGEEAGIQEPSAEQVALKKPPVLAPLSFAGLGLLGMLACARRFQSHEEPLT